MVYSIQQYANSKKIYVFQFKTIIQLNKNATWNYTNILRIACLNGAAAALERHYS